MILYWLHRKGSSSMFMTRDWENKLAAGDVYEICICKFAAVLSVVAVNFECEMNDILLYLTS